MPDTNRDKYDEVSRLIRGKVYTHSPGGDYSGESDFDLDECKDVLKSAFPPPAGDMLDLVDRIQEIHVSCSEYDGMEMTRDEAAAEIESFAQSRVEPWREALKMCAGVLAGDTTKNRLIEALEAARAMLSDSPAEDATE